MIPLRIDFACHSPECAPPPVGTGGSSPGNDAPSGELPGVVDWVSGTEWEGEVPVFDPDSEAGQAALKLLERVTGEEISPKLLTESPRAVWFDMIGFEDSRKWLSETVREGAKGGDLVILQAIHQNFIGRLHPKYRDGATVLVNRDVADNPRQETDPFAPNNGWKLRSADPVATGTGLTSWTVGAYGTFSGGVEFRGPNVPAPSDAAPAQPLRYTGGAVWEGHVPITDVLGVFGDMLLDGEVIVGRPGLVQHILRGGSTRDFDVTASLIELACYDESCAPPPVGTGGSNAGAGRAKAISAVRKAYRGTDYRGYEEQGDRLGDRLHTALDDLFADTNNPPTDEEVWETLTESIPSRQMVSNALRSDDPHPIAVATMQQMHREVVAELGGAEMSVWRSAWPGEDPFGPRSGPHGMVLKSGNRVAPGTGVTSWWGSRPTNGRKPGDDYRVRNHRSRGTIGPDQDMQDKFRADNDRSTFERTHRLTVGADRILGRFGDMRHSGEILVAHSSETIDRLMSNTFPIVPPESLVSSLTELACRDASCAPPPVGTGGSSPAGGQRYIPSREDAGFGDRFLSEIPVLPDHLKDWADKGGPFGKGMSEAQPRAMLTHARSEGDDVRTWLALTTTVEARRHLSDVAKDIGTPEMREVVNIAHEHTMRALDTLYPGVEKFEVHRVHHHPASSNKGNPDWADGRPQYGQSGITSWDFIGPADEMIGKEGTVFHPDHFVNQYETTRIVGRDEILARFGDTPDEVLLGTPQRVREVLSGPPDLSEFEEEEFSVAAIELACHDASCAPPPVGVGGSSPAGGGKVLAGRWGEPDRTAVLNAAPAVASEVAKALAKRIYDHELDEYADITSKVSSIHLDGDILTVQVDIAAPDDGEGFVGSATRRLDLRTGVVHNSRLEINEGFQGHGLGGRFTALSLKAAADAGFDEVTTDATSTEGMNGAYTWLKLGFDFGDGARYLPEHGDDALRERMTAALRSTRSAADREHLYRLTSKLDDAGVTREELLNMPDARTILGAGEPELSYRLERDISILREEPALAAAANADDDFLSWYRWALTADTDELPEALLAAGCQSEDCAPPPVGTGGSKPGTSRVLSGEELHSPDAVARARGDGRMKVGFGVPQLRIDRATFVRLLSEDPRDYATDRSRVTHEHVTDHVARIQASLMEQGITEVKLYRAAPTGQDPFRFDTEGASGVTSWTRLKSVAARYNKGDTVVHEALVPANQILTWDTVGALVRGGGTEKVGFEVLVAKPEVVQNVLEGVYPALKRTPVTAAAHAESCVWAGLESFACHSPECAPPPVGTGGSKPGTRRTLYHLTDNPQFKLDPEFVPEDNAIALRSRDAAGVYVAKDSWDVEHWVNGSGYLRPFVVELDAPEEIITDERWGNEGFIPGDKFADVEIKRVIPIDAFARETYGDYGWVEDTIGTKFDDGEAIPEYRFDQPTQRPGPEYRYEGPDVRDMPTAEVERLVRDTEAARKSRYGEEEDEEFATTTAITELACYDASCAPPPVGTGGSSPKSGPGGWDGRTVKAKFPLSPNDRWNTEGGVPVLPEHIVNWVRSVDDRDLRLAANAVGADADAEAHSSLWYYLTQTEPSRKRLSNALHHGPEDAERDLYRIVHEHYMRTAAKLYPAHGDVQPVIRDADGDDPFAPNRFFKNNAAEPDLPGSGATSWYAADFGDPYGAPLSTSGDGWHSGDVPKSQVLGRYGDTPKELIVGRPGVIEKLLGYEAD